MKHSRFFIYAAAVAALLACEKIDTPADNSPEKDDGSVVFKAVIGSDNATKAIIELNGSSKPQTFWENGDQITVYSGNGDSGSKEGCNFSTSLVSNSTSAEFIYNGEGWASGTGYLAIYPSATEARSVNFTGDGDVYKMAAVDVPSSQTLVAGGFDKNAAVLTAYSTGSTLNFKNAVALIKFQVADSNIKGGRIVVDDGDAISGRFRADLSTSAPYLPVLTKYSQPAYNYVDFSIDGSTNLSTGTDYYVAVRPTDLTSGVKVYLNGNLVKSISSGNLASFDRNKIYNLGTLTVPAKPAEKCYSFDFTVEPPTGGNAPWPTSITKGSYPHVEGGVEYIYSLYGTNYSFVLADCGGAKNKEANLFWHTTTKALVFNAQKRYLGFPAVSGYKLTKVVCFNKSGTTEASFEVVKSISPTTDHPASSEIVAASQVWAKQGINYVYEPTGTAAGTRYYLYCLVKGSIGTITLTYEPAS